MTMSITAPRSKVRLLSPEVGSLTRELPPAPQGSLYVLGSNGGMIVEPDAGFDVVFGRNSPEVHVCVGTSDQHVSRLHGHITGQDGRWVLFNLGKLPIRFPDARLVLRGEQAELPTAYTPLFIVGPRQDHLLEVRVAARPVRPDVVDSYEAETRSRSIWPLSPAEKLVLVCLSQRYLRHEPQPQPVTWAQVAEELGALRPAERWGPSKAAHIVEKLRYQLSPSVHGLLQEQVPPPVGNTLNHNLIMELLVTTTITPADLKLIGG